MSYVGDKLREREADLSALQRELDDRKLERDSLQSEVSRFYESKSQIKSLIERLRTRGDDEVYRLRAQISSRLASLVSVLLVAPLGSAPSTRSTIEWVRNEGFEGVEDVLDVMGAGLLDDRSHRRFFMAMFKDHRYRQVFPDAKDPLVYVEQVFKADDGVHRVDNRGANSLIFPNAAEERRQLERELALVRSLC